MEEMRETLDCLEEIIEGNGYKKQRDLDRPVKLPLLVLDAEELDLGLSSEVSLPEVY